jgi:hypothetical protein
MAVNRAVRTIDQFAQPLITRVYELPDRSEYPHFRQSHRNSGDSESQHNCRVDSGHIHNKSPIPPL